MVNFNKTELLEILNTEGKKATLQLFDIKAKEWSSVMKKYNVEYDNKLKQYVIPVSEEVNDEVNEISDLEDKPIENNKTIDICDFINKGGNKGTAKDKEAVKTTLPIELNSNDENKPVEAENGTNEDNTPVEGETQNLEDNTQVIDEVKAKRGRKKIELKDGFELHSQQLNKKLLRALELKALTEGVDIETLVNDLLAQSVENKYYIGVSI